VKPPNGNVASLLALKREDIEGIGLVPNREVKNPTSIVQGRLSLPEEASGSQILSESLPFFLLKRRSVCFKTISLRKAIVFNAKRESLVVLSGCAHRGIVNTVRHASKDDGMRRFTPVIEVFPFKGAKTRTDSENGRRYSKPFVQIISSQLIALVMKPFRPLLGNARSVHFKTAGTKYIISSK